MGYDETDHNERRKYVSAPKLVIRQKKPTPTPVLIEETATYDNTASDCCAELRKQMAALKLENEIQAKEIVELRTMGSAQTLKNEKQANEISEFRATVQILLTENNTLRQKFRDSEISLDGFRGNDEKTAFFFGLSSFAAMESLFIEINQYLPECRGKLSKFDVFFITLNRLRMSTSFTYFKYKFHLSHQTISKYFHKCLFVLHSSLRSLVYWPERSLLKSAMPNIFKQNFGNNVTVIVDCFEIAIQTSSQKKAACQTWSTYKHSQTVKFLIGISAVGHIMFISPGFVGRASDKQVTTDSGLLSHLQEGDLVLADRGFLIHDELKTVGAVLKIPVFTKGKEQLHPLEVESTRKIANVRIHVERIIGQLRLKYKILDLRKFPISAIYKNVNEESVMDQIVSVCCALVNLCPKIVE